jgi:hypothetical protein
MERRERIDEALEVVVGATVDDIDIDRGTSRSMQIGGDAADENALDVRIGEGANQRLNLNHDRG